MAAARAEMQNCGREIDRYMRERDAYAKALLIALSAGIFPEKARVKAEIEQCLEEWK
jgi:hypothetical protein